MASNAYQGKLTFGDKRRSPKNDVLPFRSQLLKWVGNKQRFAHEIIKNFPSDYGTYFEPFLGSGAVLGTLAPEESVASDILKPLIGIWRTLSSNPETLINWYEERWEDFENNRNAAYERIKESYNRNPNPADLLFISRSCYGGVIRFRTDGFISTPIGVHDPIDPASFRGRVSKWNKRTAGAKFISEDFESVMDQANAEDLIYCDPPYFDTQSILYGAQSFSLQRLYLAIRRAKDRGVFVVLSIDGKKKSGAKNCGVELPDGLFERFLDMNCGRSMLKRFQMDGKSLEDEVVSDRLLLTYK